MKDSDKEIEARFLDINKENLMSKLQLLKAQDLGENTLKEIIFYDSNVEWREEGKIVRIRDDSKTITLSYKHHAKDTITGAEEIELTVNNFDKAKSFLEKIGLIPYREQEKRRHSFVLNKVMIDIDTWPTMPPYVEIEGKSEEEVKAISEQLDLRWEDALFENAKIVIEKYYHIPVSKLRKFTFDQIE